MTCLQAPPAAPRRSTLLLLIAAVAGAHLALLLGPLAGTPDPAEPPVALSPPALSRPVERRDAEDVRPAAALAVARVSTVRWIVPAPATDATATQLAASPAPRPAQARAPRPDTPGIRVQTAPVPTAPQSPPQAPAMAAVATDPVPDATANTPAEAAEPTEVAAPSPSPLENPVDASPPPTDDTLLAAATTPSRASPAPLTATRALPPALPPASTQLDYAVTGRLKGLAYTANGRLDWTLAEGRYSARMEMRVFLLGSRVQTSTGRAGPGGLLPERFSDRSRSEKAAHFDHEENRIRFSNNAPDAALQPGAQDRLSLFLQIAGLLQARPEDYTRGKVIEMQVAGAGDADVWRFEVGDEVTLALPAGELRARQLRRLPRKQFDSTVEMWLAPGLQHLPVRLRVTQANGDVADQQISRMP